MKILLVQFPGKEGEMPIVPLGLGYIASALAEQEVTIYDPNLSDNPREELIKRLKKNQYDIIGISLRNIDNQMMGHPHYYYQALAPTLETIEQTSPRAKVMIGGGGFSIFPMTIMKKNPTINYGIYLDGTESVVELLNHLDHPERVKGIYYRQGESIHFTGKREPPNLDSLPSPWNYLELKKYLKYHFSVGILSKTGCVFNCIYCIYPHLTGKKLRLRSPLSVVDEIEMLVNNHFLTEFTFVDPIFNFPLKHASAICQEIIKRRIKVRWTAYFNLKYLTEEFVRMAVRAGCFVFGFSPDGIHNPSMRSLGKAITEKDLQRSYQLIRKVKGARAGYSFFLNPPGQNFVGFLKLLKFYFKTKVLCPNKFGACSFLWYLRIYPHTPLYELAIKSGVISQDVNLLPEEKEALYKLFWINPANNYLNILFKFLMPWKRTSVFIRNKLAHLRYKLSPPPISSPLEGED